MRIAAVDPGLAGALCLMSPDIFLVVDMPVFLVTRGKTQRRIVDEDLLADTLQDWSPTMTFIEEVASRPGMGVSGAFSFGRSFGVIMGVLAALKLPRTRITPQQWKKAMRVPAGKDAARQRASQLMPSHAHNWARVKDDGRAEAALLALYGHQFMSVPRPFNDPPFAMPPEAP